MHLAWPRDAAMSSSTRSRPFALNFIAGDGRQRTLPINAPAVEIDDARFQGRIMLVHDTGNEPAGMLQVCPASATNKRRGVELQIQGKFKVQVSRGDQKSAGLWVGGEFEQQMKLGWIMQSIVSMCLKYAKKKCEGRIHCSLGSKSEPPHMSFPLAQLFTLIATPPGESPPVLGSEEIGQVKWQGATVNFEPDTESTYTMVYKTPYMDLCSWELLQVPGVSPLPIESMIGDISTAKVFLYDLGHAGTQSNWSKGIVLEWFFTRGSAGEAWAEVSADVSEVEAASGPRTPLDDEASDAEEASEDDVESEEDEMHDHAVIIDDDHVSSDNSSEGSEDEEDLEEEEEQSRADSKALLEIESWRPPDSSPENTTVRLPYYIEAIDRRRRRRVRVWYVFAMSDPGAEDPYVDNNIWWFAKAATELAVLCSPRRRLPTFRRGPGARRYQCHAVRTLEQFRHVVCNHIKGDTKLRRVVFTQAIAHFSPEEMELPEEDPSETRTSEPKAVAKAAKAQPSCILAENEKGEKAKSLADKPKLNEHRVESMVDKARQHLNPEAFRQKVRAKVPTRRRGPMLPPRFFVGAGSENCGIAFAQARDGRFNVVRETLVGSIHYEGRLCEELLRLSGDGIVRCFTPYDCATPRAKFKLDEILQVKRLGAFLGRFFSWEIHTALRVYVFCSPTQDECDDWMKAVVLHPVPGALGAPLGNDAVSAEYAPVQGFAEAGLASLETGASCETFSGHEESLKKGGEVVDQRKAMAGGISVRIKMGKRMSEMMRRRELANFYRPENLKAFEPLMDSTRARRWRFEKRLVLNDRILLTESDFKAGMPPSLAGSMLEKVLGFSTLPSTRDLISFVDDTCRLKAVRFANWTQAELHAFWLNVYHCLLLHGLLVLGSPKSSNELSRFHNRVSYLVGLRPVSLREIERIVLRVPKVPNQSVPEQAQLRAMQLVGGFFRMGSLCRCLSSGPGSPRSRLPDADGGENRRTSTASAASKASDTAMPMKCMPMPKVQLPKPWIRPSLGSASCLYAGEPPERVVVPTQDSRVVLVLNRGSTSCSHFIPVFSCTEFEAQMDAVAKSFIDIFMKVQERDGKVLTVSLPQRLMGIKRTHKEDNQETLHFLWRFVLPSQAALTRSTQLKFVRHKEEPRERADFQRAITTPLLKQNTAESTVLCL